MLARSFVKHPAFWKKFAFAAWAIAIVVVCVRIGCSRTATWQDVYPVYDSAARNWINGVDLYRNTAFDYRYSPLFAAALAPTTWLPLKVASILWRLFSATAFLCALISTIRAKVPRAITTSECSLFLLMLLPLALGNLNFGQANLILLAALLASIAAVACGKWTLGALLVAAAVTIKIYALALGLLLVILYPRKLAWRVLAAFAIAIALPFAFQSPGYVVKQYGDWLHYLKTDDRTSRPLTQWYIDLRLMFRVWFVPLSATAYLFIQIVIGLALAVLGLFAKSRGWPREKLVGWIFALTTCYLTVVGPTTESATYVLIAPATAWLVTGLLINGDTALGTVWLMAVYLLQLVPRMMAWFGGIGRVSVYTNPLPLSALLLAAWLVRQVFLRPAAVAESGPIGATPAD